MGHKYHLELEKFWPGYYCRGTIVVSENFWWMAWVGLLHSPEHSIVENIWIFLAKNGIQVTHYIFKQKPKFLILDINWPFLLHMYEYL